LYSVEYVDVDVIVSVIVLFSMSAIKCSYCALSVSEMAYNVSSYFVYFVVMLNLTHSLLCFVVWMTVRAYGL